MKTMKMLVLGMLPALTLAQQCLPGQTPCKNTCCNTNEDYTCCPYNGGYCAPPDKQCCEGNIFTGLCPKEDTCCAHGCARPEQECCGKGIHICNKGSCCNATETCMKSGDSCCEAPSSKISSNPKWICPEEKPSCCSVITTKQCRKEEEHSPFLGLAQCCSEDEVCCPDALSRTGTNFAQVDGCDSDTGGERACANPKKEFCCGGMACPTQELCCINLVDGHPDWLPFGGGCCHGYPSRNNTCHKVDKDHNLCPNQVEPYLKWKKEQQVVKSKESIQAAVADVVPANVV